MTLRFINMQKHDTVNYSWARFLNCLNQLDDKLTGAFTKCNINDENSSQYMCPKDHVDDQK
jgi:hypothetical protein